MSHAVTIAPPPFRSASGAFEVHQIPAARDNLVWLITCLKTGKCAVVDGPDAQATLDYADDHDLVLTHVLNTHTHEDHIGVNRDLARRKLLSDLVVVGYENAPSEIPGLNHPVSDGGRFQLGELDVRVMLTEGHIYGHICFVVEDVLFCGDALFTGGCGRVFTGNFPLMFDSLSKLRSLDPHLRVCCAHEYTLDNLRFAQSVEPENAALRARLDEVEAARSQGRSCVPARLATELETNPMLRWDSPELVAQVRRQWRVSDLGDPAAVFKATRQLKDSGRYRH